MNTTTKTVKITFTLIVLLLSSGIAFSNALASGTEAAAQEVVKKTTGDMAKEAASEVADATKEKAIGMAKDQANSAVDSALGKVDEAMKPGEKAADAARDATK